MKNKDIAKAIKLLIKKLESTEKFILKQAPDICREIIREVYVDYLPQYLLGTTFLVTSILRFFYMPLWRSGDNGVFASDVLTVFTTIAGIVGLIMMFDALSWLLMATYCPKLYILRELRRLVR